MPKPEPPPETPAIRQDARSPHKALRGIQVTAISLSGLAGRQESLWVAAVVV